MSLIWVVSASNAVVIFQWFLWGYSLAFSSSATNGYIGNLQHVVLLRVLDEPSPGSPLIPELVYSFFQMEFACVTVGILMGGIAERGRVFPAMVFAFIWTTIVYCPIGTSPIFFRLFHTDISRKRTGHGDQTAGHLNGEYSTLQASLISVIAHR